MNDDSTQTVSRPRGTNLAVADARRGRAGRGVVLLHPRRKTLLRSGGGRLGEQRRPLQPRRGARRAGAGGALHARDGLRRAGRDRRRWTYAAQDRRSLLPAPLDSVYFVNSGAEAVEGALKLAKRFTRTYGDSSPMRRAYHGSTHGAMSMMGAPEGEEWKGAFRPLLPDVQAIEFNDFDDLERITRRTACVLAEPVQGEAGVRPPRPGYLEALRRALRRSGRAADLRRDTDRHGPHGRTVRHAANTASRPTSSVWPRPSAAACP